MAGTPSRMNQSAREQILSTDLNRIGNLAGRELMDAAQSRSVRADFYAPGTNTFDDFTAVSKVAQAIPLSGLTKVPSLDGIAAQFDMNIGAGEGQMPSTPANPDISGYELLRWDAQTVAWPLGGTPDATNPKICLIVATPADVLTDVLSRNILLDPSTRTVSPQNVYKTSNPVATLSVVVGTAAAAPVAPAVPAGALAVFEVYVPPLVADSTFFLPVRRAWRQIEFPGTSQHGIVKGCVPFVGAGFAAPILLTVANQPHRIVIDGELLTFAVTPSSWLQVDGDVAAPPVAAPGGNDAPAYLYLCGGRNFPHLNYKMVSAAVTPVPVTFIASLTPPDSLGYPTASLAIATPSRTFPRAACCYVGLYFRNAGLTTMVPSIYDGDWIYSLQTISGTDVKGFLQPSVNPTNTFAAYTFAGQPAISDMVDLTVLFTDGSPDEGFVSTSNTTSGLFFSASTSATLGFGKGAQKLALTANPFAVYVKSTGGTGTLVIAASGYNMHIPRLAR